MSRYTGPRLKIIRRLGTMLPGLMRTDATLRRPYGPGQHGPSKKGKLSDYAMRLREKQKLRFHYNISEKQLARYIQKAFKGKGNSGLTLLELLEQRLDNAIFRAGFAPSMAAARQIVRHGHIAVNGKRIDIPSYTLRVGDMVAPTANTKMKDKISANRQDPENLSLPGFLLMSENNPLEFKITQKPSRDDVPLILNEQLIIEYYSGR